MAAATPKHPKDVTHLAYLEQITTNVSQFATSMHNQPVRSLSSAFYQGAEPMRAPSASLPQSLTAGALPSQSPGPFSAFFSAARRPLAQCIYP
ncbi:hypothetical protein HaLaN_10958 [Haematococcus lacustris]|uniref:Uncharacterized protein n=1 Tax=Haematococcus lacustris TaxID=44745 RepID=A0A699Z007_HAELA|nr:hypothetical protein HaLaN_10958 [Haematococcus lacustris]